MANYTKKHRMSNTRIYKIWQDMKDRCLNKNNPFFHRYGGRDIIVCEQWLDKDNGFINFYNDMSTTYFDKATIDRKENDEDYEKDNCQWLSNAKNVSKAHKGIPLSDSHCQNISKGKTKLTYDKLLDIQKYLEVHYLEEAIEYFKISKSTINRAFREQKLYKPVKKKDSRYQIPQSIIQEVQKIKELVNGGLSMTKACEQSNISRPTFRKYKDI